jgi:hypothetical protein
MLRRITILVLFLSVQALAKEDYRDEPCKSSNLAPSCFQTHARLGAGEGTPSVRLWPIGSHRLYGIYSNRQGFADRYTTLDSEAPGLPPEVERAATRIQKVSGPGGWTLFGDFEVCPLEPHIEGHMQAACIASATHIFVPKQ